MNRPPNQDSRERRIYTVQQLNRSVRQLLERDYGPLWLEGEISNLARPASGHWYFSLKDDQAQVRCALFRNRRPAGGWVPANGEQVLIWGRVSLYEARGEFQVIAESMEPLGDGRLRRELERLMVRLQAEGLFAAEHKRPLPVLPRRIGVITSLTGAALRDVLQVLGRRAPFIPVIVYPSLVQGEEAAGRLRRALQTAMDRNECDVLLLVRGGGSLEDLWPFNDETLARLVRASPIPIVSGVGHEVDVTVVDLAADLRAPTPSAAAELVSPDRAQLERRVQRLGQSLGRAALRRIQTLRRETDACARRLAAQHPLRRLQQLQQGCDELGLRLQRAAGLGLERRLAHLQRLEERLRALSPRTRIETLGLRLQRLAERLREGERRHLDQARYRLESLMRALDGVSPLATLERGYAVVRRLDDGRAVHAATEVAIGDRVEARLAQGRLECRVEAIDGSDREPPRHDTDMT